MLFPMMIASHWGSDRHVEHDPGQVLKLKASEFFHLGLSTARVEVSEMWVADDDISKFVGSFSGSCMLERVIFKILFKFENNQTIFFLNKCYESVAKIMDWTLQFYLFQKIQKIFFAKLF